MNLKEFFKNPQYDSLKTVGLIVVVGFLGVFLYTHNFLRIDQTGRALNDTLHNNPINGNANYRVISLSGVPPHAGGACEVLMNSGAIIHSVFHQDSIQCASGFSCGYGIPNNFCYVSSVDQNNPSSSNPSIPLNTTYSTDKTNSSK